MKLKMVNTDIIAPKSHHTKSINLHLSCCKTFISLQNVVKSVKRAFCDCALYILMFGNNIVAVK